MPVIRIDDEVMRELQSRAVNMGLVFGQPNQVLRGVLGLDDAVDRPEDAKPQPMPGGRRVTGRILLREHKDLAQDMKPYADRDGIFYEWPKMFPAILFDSRGYLIFRSEQALLDAEAYVRLYPDKRKISVRDGISSMPGYVTCRHDH